MSGLSTVPLSLVYIILLFVPGLLGLDLYLKSSQLVGRFSRLQYLAYSVFLSLLSLCLLYFLTPFYLGHFAPDVPRFPSETHLATIPQLTRLTLPDLVSLYILHVLSAGALGLAFGFFNREILNPDEERDRREPWAYTFDEAVLPPETVQVQLSDDKIVEGMWERKTWSEQKRELYLQEPREVSFDGDEKRTDPIGRGIFINTDDILQVILLDSDPQTDPEEVEAEDSEVSKDAEEDTDELHELGLEEMTDKEFLNEITDHFNDEDDETDFDVENAE